MSFNQLISSFKRETIAIYATFAHEKIKKKAKKNFE
jgi:hypothetical protein